MCLASQTLAVGMPCLMLHTLPQILQTLLRLMLLRCFLMLVHHHWHWSMVCLAQS